MRKKGFTLVELLAVVMILGILAIIVVASTMDMFNKTKSEIFETELKNIFSMIEDEYFLDTMNEKDNQVYCNIEDCWGKELKLFGGKDLKYSIKVNSHGEVICFQATKGPYYYISQGITKSSEVINNVRKINGKKVDFIPDCTYSVDYRNIKRINVLNIYPDNTTDAKYAVKANGGEFSGCERYKKYQSSKLKNWMEDIPEELPEEAPNGFGKGIIKVIPVSFTEFNSNPDPDYWVKSYYDDGCIEKLVIDSIEESEMEEAYSEDFPEGGYVPDEDKVVDDTPDFNTEKADLIFIGTWDANGRTAYSTEAIEALTKWTSENKPIIAGHDVLILSETQSVPFTNSLSSYFGVDVRESGISPILGKAHILSKKKRNIFTLWPWVIMNKGDNGNEGLDIPKTHSTAQYVNKGDVWITLGAVEVTEEKAKNNYFYLETYKNTAIIQTGHSNCEASEDEQKVIANTIFFMYYSFVLSEHGDEI